MRLLYIGKYQFKKTNTGYAALPAYGDAFWAKYLDVFEGVDVLGEEIKGYLNNGTVTDITDPRVTVRLVAPNTNPKDFKNDGIVKRELNAAISKAEAVLIKPSCRKGMMAIEICKKLNKPYMVELTGDLKLTLSLHRSFLKRMYGPIIHKQVLRAIKDCKFGLYVTEEYLQKIYPIAGEQCGCTDTFIPDPDEKALEQRIEKINGTHDKFIIGLVASYHDNRKGIDIIIEALNKMKTTNVELHILGLGTEEDRKKWFKYAEEQGVKDKVIFDQSLAGVEKVLEWNDGIDIAILPSRSEGLPRCIVESMSRACPCILSDAAGMPELIEHKWLHKPGDAEKLAKLIDSMCNSNKNMEDAAKKNFDRSKDFAQKVLTSRRNAFLNRFKEYASSL